jgi:hypothetical protein
MIDAANHPVLVHDAPRVRPFAAALRWSFNQKTVFPLISRLGRQKACR